MKTDVFNIKQNHASFEELLLFFVKNSNAFIPDLKTQVESLYDYVDKLKKNATFFEAYDDNTLVGLVAVYLNDYETKVAFITSIVVSAEYQGKGIAGTLLKVAIDTAVLHKFTTIKLEVFSGNVKAIKLYKNYGFEERKKSYITMELKI